MRRSKENTITAKGDPANQSIPKSALTPSEVSERELRSKSLLKLAADILKPVIVLLLGVVAALVFFPFQISTSLPAAVLILASMAIVVIAWLRRATLPIAIAAFLAASGIIWAVFGIFIFASGPLYCYSGHGLKPYEARLIPLGENQSRGQLFFITDSVRSSNVVAAIAKRLNSNVVFIQTESSGENHFMRIPLTGAITHTIVGTSPNSGTRQVELSYVGPSLVVGVDTHGGIGLVVAIKLHSFPLVAYLHNANDTDEAEWDRVEYKPSHELDTAEYVATLDSALSGAVRADFETAIGGLEKAYLHAPPGIEHARDRALLGAVTSGLLDGSIGETQSLSYMFQAFSNWPHAKNVKGNVIDNTELSSGVDRWLYGTLRRTFFYHQKEYPQIAKALGFHDLPSKVGVLARSGDQTRFAEAVTGTDNGIERSLVFSDDADKLTALAHSSLNTASFQQSLTQEFGESSEIRRWAAEVLVDQEDFSDANLDNATNWLVDQMSEPSRTQYKNYRQLLQLLLSAWRNPAPKSEELSNAYQQIAEKYAFSQLALTFKALKEGSDFPNGSKFQFPYPGGVPNTPWWDRRFLDWFAVTSMFLSANLNDAGDECPSPSCEERLKSTAHEFRKYQTTEKISFAPGVALVLGAAQIFEQPTDKYWRDSYRDALGAEFVGLDLGKNPAQRTQLSPKPDEIAAKVERIIVEQLGLDESAVRESARFTQDLRLNSTDVLELIMAWEEAFNIVISDDEASKLVKVNDAINCVKKHLREAKRPIRSSL